MPQSIRRFDLTSTFDVVQARQCAREMARDLGFGLTDQTRIATAVSDLARRALDSGVQGSVRFTVVTSGARRGLECTSVGGSKLGIASNPAQGGIFGGIERLVDEFETEPGIGEEVAVIMRKWLPQDLAEGLSKLGLASAPPVAPRASV